MKGPEGLGLTVGMGGPGRYPIGIGVKREDIPTNFLDKFYVRKPGMKYLQVDEIMLQKTKEYEKLAQEMWGHLIK